MFKKAKKLFQEPTRFLFESKYTVLSGTGDLCIKLNRKFLNAAYKTALSESLLISVIITVYNDEDNILNALDSILFQSHKKIEIIIIDDASTDRTSEFLQNVSKNEPRISLFRNSNNKGTYFSKNFALSKAKGQYITFQDSDDSSHPDRIRLQLLHVLRHKVVGCYCYTETVDSNGSFIKVNGNKYRRGAITLFFDREIVVEKLGSFDQVRLGADTEFLDRMTTTFGPQFKKLYDILYKVNFTSNSLTRSSPEKSGISWTRISETEFKFTVIGNRAQYIKHYKNWHNNIKLGVSPPHTNSKPHFIEH